MSKYDETKQNALSLSWQIQNKHMRHAWVRPMRNIVSAVKKKRKEKKTYLFISSPFKCPFLLCDVI